MPIKKRDGGKIKNPVDRKMPTIRIMRDVKDRLYDVSEKGETYSACIDRLIEHYKKTAK